MAQSVKLRFLCKYLPGFPIWGWEGREGLKALSEGDCDTALALWRSLAEEGDPEAYFRLGLLHASGDCVDQDKDAAASWMAKAARLKHSPARRQLNAAAREGNTHAQFELAMMYQGGIGIPQNRRHAHKLMEIAADKGHSEAQVEWGRSNCQGFLYPRWMRFFMWNVLEPNLPKAFQLFCASAKSGNPRGKLFLGLSYESGFGVAPDNRKAFQLVSEAANEGVVRAQLILASYYWNGEITGKNIELANKWFETAQSNMTEDSDWDTCDLLADSYIDGLCCEPDLVKGYYWKAVAYRERGHLLDENLKDVKKRMTRSEIKEAKSLLKRVKIYG